MRSIGPIVRSDEVRSYLRICTIVCACTRPVSCTTYTILQQGGEDGAPRTSSQYSHFLSLTIHEMIHRHSSVYISNLYNNNLTNASSLDATRDIN